jgi:solute carrier family 25 S-adenosylmethionine transporter 26
MNVEAPFSLALVAGGFAGTSVDVALYPLDTLRTRLQSTEGFWKAGGYQNIYRGLHAAAIGAAPTAAVFFSTYEGSKKLLSRPGSEAPWWTPSAAATAGEVVACVVRVPTAVVTQRMQVGRYNQVAEAVRSIWASGGARAFYTGYWATVAREIPFSFIQFPIYERLKIVWASKQGTEVTPLQGAACGSAAGLIAGVLTTPLDVVKTRRMLENMSEGKKKIY